VLWEREQNVRELTGCEAKKRGCQSLAPSHRWGAARLSISARPASQRENPYHVRQAPWSKARKSDGLWAFQKRAISRLAWAWAQNLSGSAWRMKGSCEDVPRCSILQPFSHITRGV